MVRLTVPETAFTVTVYVVEALVVVEAFVVVEAVVDDDCTDAAFGVAPPPPHASCASSTRARISNPASRRVRAEEARFRRANAPGSMTIPSAPGAQNANSGKLWWRDAVMAEVEMVSATEVIDAPGVTVAGAKLQVAPAGRFEQESVTGSEAPVSVSPRENCAV